MIKLLSILSLILLVGCYNDNIVYHNTTINNTIIKEVQIKEVRTPACPVIPDCICNYKETECKTSIKTVVADGCTKKLNLCNVRLDQTDDYLFECLKTNTTERYEDLNENLTECHKDRDEYKEELDQIKELVN